MSTIEFRARNPATGATDTDLYDVKPVRHSVNRFDSGAVLSFLDTDGTKIDDYEFGQRVDVQITQNGDADLGYGESYGESYGTGVEWTAFFSAITLTPKQTTNDGIPSVEVEALGYTHLLTRDNINKDYSSQAKSAILKDVIESFTSVRWNASNVDVQNDSTVDLSVRGETPDEVIARIASLSANEEFFVNSDLEFVFRSRDVNRAPPITDADVIDYDLPTEGKREVNQYSVFYTSNLSESWTEEDRQGQQDFKDKLDAPRRGIISDSDSYPEVSTEAEAKEIAKRRLGNQSILQTGTVTVPLGRFDTEPGDVLSLTISDAGIEDTDFRVAQKDTEWANGTVQLTIAENTAGDIEELLVALSDSLSNARMRDADPNANEVKSLPLTSSVTLSLTAALTTKTQGSGFVLGQSQLGQGTNDQLGGSVSATSSVTVESKKATTALLNLLRDLWQDDNSAFTDLTHAAVGTGDSTATHADSSLEAEAERVELEKFGAGNAAEKFEFTATVPAGGVVADGSDLAEFSIADAASGGNHYARVTFADTTIDADTRLKIHLEIEVDSSPSDGQGVVVSKGQERIRDLVIGESNHRATDMVWGEGTATATESDTSLGSKQHEDTIDSRADGPPGVARIIERVLAGDADTTDFSEVGLENAADELLQRIVFEPYGSDEVVEGDIGIEVTNA